MIMPTSLITISLRTLKNSSINLAFSPIFPMQIPNATKNPMRPIRIHIEALLTSIYSVHVAFYMHGIKAVLYTQDIHATLELKWFLDHIFCCTLGGISSKPSCWMWRSYFYFVRNSLDLHNKRKIITNKKDCFMTIKYLKKKKNGK